MYPRKKLIPHLILQDGYIFSYNNQKSLFLKFFWKYLCWHLFCPVFLKNKKIRCSTRLLKAAECFFPEYMSLTMYVRHGIKQVYFSDIAFFCYPYAVRRSCARKTLERAPVLGRKCQSEEKKV